VEFKHFEDNSLNPESILRNIVEIVTGMVSLIPEIPELEGMSTTELYVFLFSATSDKVSNGTLSKQLNISKAAVSIATKSLIKKGVIKIFNLKKTEGIFTLSYLMKEKVFTKSY